MNANYLIPSENLAYLKDRLDIIAKKAAKLGFDFDYSVSDKPVEYRSDLGSHGLIGYHSVTICGQEPIIAGWKFVAVLQHEATGNVIRKPEFIQAELPILYRTIDQRCDHCGFNRNRKDTYILQSVNSGEFKQVGSACLKDFVGHGDPHAIAAFLESLIDLEEEIGDAGEISEGGNSIYHKPETYLAYVVASIEAWGWVSRSNSNGKMPTADDAAVAMMPPKNQTEERLTVTEAHRIEAETALQWICDNWTDYATMNEYQCNVATVANKEYVQHRDLGLLASVIPAYRKAQEKAVSGGEWVGQVGKRIETTITHVATFVTVNRYGRDVVTTYINKFVDGQGNIIVWMTGTFNGNDHKGQSFTMAAHVKEHSEFQGKRQTVVTRAKLTELR